MVTRLREIASWLLLRGAGNLAGMIIICKSGIKYYGIGYNGKSYNMISLKQESVITQNRNQP